MRNGRIHSEQFKGPTLMYVEIKKIIQMNVLYTHAVRLRVFSRDYVSPHAVVRFVLLEIHCVGISDEVSNMNNFMSLQ